MTKPIGQVHSNHSARICGPDQETSNMGTSNQMQKLIALFADKDTDEMQNILSSGVLTDVRDGDLELFLRLRDVRRGLAEIKPIPHVLDLVTIPKLPFSGATVVEHKGTGVVRLERRGDDLYLDGQKIEFHLSSKQKNGTIGGNDLRKYLEKKSTLNATVLDYLLEHPELIPDSWKVDEAGKTRYIFFWGTIYRSADGDLYVRCLFWGGGRWVSDYSWLGGRWGVNCPAALLAS